MSATQVLTELENALGQSIPPGTAHVSWSRSRDLSGLCERSLADSISGRQRLITVMEGQCWL